MLDEFNHLTLDIIGKVCIEIYSIKVTRYIYVIFVTIIFGQGSLFMAWWFLYLLYGTRNIQDQFSCLRALCLRQRTSKNNYRQPTLQNSNFLPLISVCLLSDYKLLKTYSQMNVFRSYCPLKKNFDKIQCFLHIYFFKNCNLN